MMVPSLSLPFFAVTSKCTAGIMVYSSYACLRFDHPFCSAL